ncbi:hypothetical protein RhiirA1_471838 [Rhizophagus irregularis]|uniref:Uncharacterized protein n=1 Tax=Rhizophagus irregularis TaxID=588596 RepID=A0A2N0R3I9_9GLOM|nr:hypothetical protein RhiirA1_471838 [Rhizophagus irregularis]
MFKKGLQDATSKDELELVATICMLMTMSDGTIYDNNEDNMTKVCLNNNVSWEFGLYWNNKLIPREFYKELNQSYYKASWLILDINRHYRMSLYEVDIGHYMRLLCKNIIKKYH